MKKNNSKKGLGFDSVLTIIFVVLKLIGVINWSWVWVLSPLWICVATGIVFMIFMVLVEKYKKTLDK